MLEGKLVNILRCKNRPKWAGRLHFAHQMKFHPTIKIQGKEKIFKKKVTFAVFETLPGGEGRLRNLHENWVLLSLCYLLSLPESGFHDFLDFFSKKR